MKEMSTKKIITIIAIVGVLAIIGSIQVIKVVAGNIEKKFSSDDKTVVAENGDITSISKEDAKKLIDDAEKELDSKTNNSNTTATTKTESQMRAEKQNSIKNSQIKLPKSSIVPNTDFDYNNTIGVAYVNGNYYVGYYCGFEQVWKASDKAITNIIMMRVKRNRGDDPELSRDFFDKVKAYTPYIGAIQQMEFETADPDKMLTIVENYMQDLVRMNLRNKDRLFYFKIQSIIGTNEEFFKVTDPGNKNKPIQTALDELSTLDPKQYPALNVELR